MTSCLDIPNKGLSILFTCTGVDFKPCKRVPLNKFIKNVSTLSDRVCPNKRYSSSSMFIFNSFILTFLIWVSDALGSKEVCSETKAIPNWLAIDFACSSKSLE